VTNWLDVYKHHNYLVNIESKKSKKIDFLLAANYFLGKETMQMKHWLTDFYKKNGSQLRNSHF
jgi:hypothetical protein